MQDPIGEENSKSRREAERRASRDRSAVVVLGPPGSGKTTVADGLGWLPGVRAVVTGRMLRREASREDAPAVLQESVEQGEFAPTETVTNVLVRELSGVEARALVFDGFPRSRDQEDYFFRLIAKLGFSFAGLIVLDVSREIADRRLAGRTRPDDKGHTLAERREVYERETVPLIRELEDRPAGHVYHVSAEPPAEVVIESVARLLERKRVVVDSDRIEDREPRQRQD